MMARSAIAQINGPECKKYCTPFRVALYKLWLNDDELEQKDLKAFSYMFDVLATNNDYNAAGPKIESTHFDPDGLISFVNKNYYYDASRDRAVPKQKRPNTQKRHANANRVDMKNQASGANHRI